MQMYKAMLSRLRGARKIEWILLFAAAAVLVLLFTRENINFSSNYAGTELERRMENVLSSVHGAGRVRVLVSEQPEVVSAFSQTGANTPVVQGVVIVAEGAGNIRVALELARAAKTFLGVDLERIEVLAMEGGV